MVSGGRRNVIVRCVSTRSRTGCKWASPKRQAPQELGNMRKLAQQDGSPGTFGASCLLSKNALPRSSRIWLASIAEHWIGSTMRLNAELLARSAPIQGPQTVVNSFTVVAFPPVGGSRSIMNLETWAHAGPNFNTGAGAIQPAATGDGTFRSAEKCRATISSPPILVMNSPILVGRLNSQAPQKHTSSRRPPASRSCR